MGTYSPFLFQKWKLGRSIRNVGGRAVKFKRYCSKLIITQLLLTVMCQAPRIRSILWLSGEFRVSHAWLAACGAGDMNIWRCCPSLRRHPWGTIAKTTMAWWGWRRPWRRVGWWWWRETVWRQGDSQTQTDIVGRNALDMMIASPVDYFMTYNLRELA